MSHQSSHHRNLRHNRESVSIRIKIVVHGDNVALKPLTKIPGQHCKNVFLAPDDVQKFANCYPSVCNRGDDCTSAIKSGSVVQMDMEDYHALAGV